MLLYNFQLSVNVGAEGLILINLLVQGSAALLRALTPPFGQYAAEGQRLEGEFRWTHSRLIENSEEIAFYRGQATEKNGIERAYFSLIKHVNRVYRIRIGHGMVEEGIIKWFWGALGVSVAHSTRKRENINANTLLRQCAPPCSARDLRHTCIRQDSRSQSRRLGIAHRGICHQSQAFALQQ